MPTLTYRTVDIRKLEGAAVVIHLSKGDVGDRGVFAYVPSVRRRHRRNRFWRSLGPTVTIQQARGAAARLAGQYELDEVVVIDPHGLMGA